jgi:hypothetical protein
MLETPDAAAGEAVLLMLALGGAALRAKPYTLTLIPKL